MGLNIKNQAVEELATEVARLAGETKTEAIRRALEERKEKLARAIPPTDRRASLTRFLESEIWPALPRGARRRLSKREREAILGYGRSGV